VWSSEKFAVSSKNLSTGQKSHGEKFEVANFPVDKLPIFVAHTSSMA
jgi:hypothetical protein